MQRPLYFAVLKPIKHDIYVHGTKRLSVFYYKKYVLHYNSTYTVRIKGRRAIRISRNSGLLDFFFENKLHWQFEVRLVLFTVCTCI